MQLCEIQNTKNEEETVYREKNQAQYEIKDIKLPSNQLTTTMNNECQQQ